MLDLAIRGGRVVDGSGSPARRCDVGIRGGRIVQVGRVPDPAEVTIDASDRVVSPGFVDVHTHLDAQVFWDPALTPSSLHGVTTALAGNCGFTLAPLDAEAASYLLPMLAVVEGMPLDALQAGVPCDWQSSAEYFDRVEARLGINLGLSVGHSALRRVVMGVDATRRAARADEVARMAELLGAGLGAGGLGFSSSWGVAHFDAAGDPVPSRFAQMDELTALAAVCAGFDGTTLEFIPPRVDVFGAVEQEALCQMSTLAGQPVNWNLNRISAATVEECRALVHATTKDGARVVGLTMPIPSRARFSFATGFVIDALPGWHEVMALPRQERRRALSDPDVRQRLHASSPESAGLREIAEWGNRIITEVGDPGLQDLVGSRVDELARRSGVSALDALLDVACADDLRTTFTRPASEPGRADWLAIRELLQGDGFVIGGSDAGAHLDFTATFDYPVYVLEHGVRRHHAFSLEEAVHLLTEVPARLYGLRDRGRLVEGAWADITIFDEATVACGALETRYDLPAGAGRLYAEPTGIGQVLVNGTVIVEDGRPTGVHPGRLLRSGRDTTGRNDRWPAPRSHP